MKMFFAPNGLPITRAAGISFDSPDIELDHEGNSDLGAFDQFPSFDRFEIPWLGYILLDSTGSEWLEQHCRLIEVDDDFDVWADKETDLAWDKAIVSACHRVQCLGQTLWCTEKLRRWSAEDLLDDPVFSVAIETIIEGRVKGEIATLQEQIRVWRAANPDVTTMLSEDAEDAPCPINRRPQSTCPDGCTHGA